MTRADGLGSRYWCLQLKILGIEFDSQDPTWIYDLETLRFLQVNDAAIRGYGYSRAEFLQLTLLDIRPTGDVIRFLRSWQHPHESQADRWVHVGKNGISFAVVITSRELVFDGRKAEIVIAKRESTAVSPPGQQVITGNLVR